MHSKNASLSVEVPPRRESYEKNKEGDYVRVVAREWTQADAKNGLFYGYFAGIAAQ